ncbi:MAG: hypothetical protein ABJC12_09715 [Saprospiraceae bacterium]
MKKERLAPSKAKLVIQILIKDLLNLFLFFKSRNDELMRLRIKLNTLDENNPDYIEIFYDRRENNKMSFRFVILILSFLVDFFLLNTALDILCYQFGWPNILKFVVPVVLIILEIGISYFSALQARDEEKVSHLGKNLQYLILPMLMGFSLLAIFYNAQSFIEGIDGMSFASFVTFNGIIQIILLISSIMLHLWLIRNSEEIAEAIAYVRYKMARNVIVDAIEKIERSNSAKYMPHFTRLTHEYVRKTDDFKRKFPEEHFNFPSTMPQELVDGMNKVMGRRIITLDIEKMSNLNKVE